MRFVIIEYPPGSVIPDEAGLWTACWGDREQAERVLDAWNQGLAGRFLPSERPWFASSFYGAPGDDVFYLRVPGQPLRTKLTVWCIAPEHLAVPPTPPLGPEFGTYDL